MNVASFNLGKIKGEKGERGIAGEKGERGDRGERGQSGYTPVFSVEETVTLNSEESAYVSLDNTDIQNPKIKFFIPKGKNGSDAHGDMQKNVYDPNGKSEDIYEFAQKCAKDKMPSAGGVFLGKVEAYTSDCEDSCIRNISVCKKLPETAKNGDICIQECRGSDITLGELLVGSIVFIKENSVYAEYIVAHRDYYKEKGTVLVRKKLLGEAVVYDRQNKSKYSQSDIDNYLNSVILNSYDIKQKLLNITLQNDGIKRKVFIPSMHETSDFEYFKKNGVIAQNENNLSASNYWIRTQDGDSNIYIVSPSGQYSSAGTQGSQYLRPAIVLSNSLKVENANISETSGYKISDEWAKIHIYQNGAWKECGRYDN